MCETHCKSCDCNKGVTLSPEKQARVNELALRQAWYWTDYSKGTLAYQDRYGSRWEDDAKELRDLLTAPPAPPKPETRGEHVASLCVWRCSDSSELGFNGRGMCGTHHQFFRPASDNVGRKTTLESFRESLAFLLDFEIAAAEKRGAEKVVGHLERCKPTVCHIEADFVCGWDAGVKAAISIAKEATR